MPYCGDCKEECNAKKVDFGIGPYECHGFRGVDVCIGYVSDCCEGDLFEDEDCTDEYHAEDYYD